MTEELYSKAKEIKLRIAHIDEVLRFLQVVTELKNSVEMRDAGGPLVAHMTKEDIPFVIQAYEEEKIRLEEVFNRL